MKSDEREKWERFYAAMERAEEDALSQAFGEQFARLIERLVPAGSAILEAGCGSGLQSLALARLGKYSLALLDFSREALRVAEAAFAQAGQKADFVCADAVEPDQPRYDLVFNLGVLEHYSFDEQVAFLRGMASRSRDLVLVVVPNRLCYWYWLWRIDRQAGQAWPFGREMPPSNLSKAMAAAGITFLGHTFLDAASTERFLRVAPGLSRDLLSLLVKAHRSPLIPDASKCYLLAALGTVRGTTVPCPPEWEKQPFGREPALADVTASLAEELARRQAAEREARSLSLRLKKSDTKLHALQGDLLVKDEAIADLASRLKAIHATRWWKIACRYSAIRNRFRRPASPPEPSGSPAEDETRRLFTPTPHYDVLVFPIIDWDFRLQRPQQLARQFAAQGHRVFYFQTFFHPPAEAAPGPARIIETGIAEVRLPGLPEWNIYRTEITGTQQRQWRKVLSDLRRDFDVTEAVCLVDLPFWGPLAFDLRTRFGWKVIYDCMDFHAGFDNTTPTMLQHEAALLRDSDLLVTTSSKLLEEAQPARPDALLVRNGCEYLHFACPPETPADAEKMPGPRVGYYGAVSEWFDGDLVVRLSQRRPDWSFVLIGRVVGLDPEPMRNRPNIELLGEQPYDALPTFLRDFDVCLIPFRQTPLTRHTDPVKFYEFLSGGKPVVSIPLPDLEPFEAQGLVRFAETPEEFEQQIERALQENGPDWIGKRQTAARQHTWHERFTRLQGAIGGLWPRATIVMVTHNGLALTRQAVRSVLQHTVWPAFDLVVVDNGSTDGTADDLQQLTREEARVKVILQERNEGFARASNRGIRESEGEYVVLLNNDTVVTRGWLGRLIRHLERNRDAAMAGPLTNSCGNEARIAVSYRDGRERDAFAAALARENDGRSFDVSMLALFCTVIRREALREVGLLDERFEVGMFEDDDLARRFRDRKYRLLCARDTFVHHEGRGTFARMADREYVRLFEANRKKFEDKWGTLWENQALRQRLPDEERIPLLRRDLRWILNRHPDRRGVMVYPPTIDWSIDLFQRPQQLAIGLSAAGYLFIFCTPTPGTDNLAGFRYLGPNLYAYHGPLEIFDEMPAPIVWISRADLRRHLRHFSRPWVVYDWIDDLSVFHAYYPRMTRPHRALLRTADLCLATATRLADEARKRRPDVRLCPNAADYDLFARAQNRSAAPIPEELKPLTGTGRPIVGYFGALAGWLDYDLIRHVAECRPEWQLLLIGPDHDGTLPREQLAPLSNVTWLGARKYQTIPRYLAWFDVAWIPFHVNRITLATSPIKLFEYMAGGKPIVAADLPECRKYSPVLVARTHAAFVSQLDRAMTLRHDARYLAELDAVARQNSWQARVEEITALLPDAKRAGGRPTP